MRTFSTFKAFKPQWFRRLLLFQTCALQQFGSVDGFTDRQQIGIADTEPTGTVESRDQKIAALSFFFALGFEMKICSAWT